MVAAGLADASSADALAVSASERARRETDRLIARRKREILERECFGLIEFVEPKHGFEVVGGMDEVKKDLLVIAEAFAKVAPPRADGHSFHRPDGHRARLCPPKPSPKNAV
ncbi:MAG: hypothetical protein WKF30_10115 [Pyrinomonadaceae bacterium]